MPTSLLKSVLPVVAVLFAVGHAAAAEKAASASSAKKPTLVISLTSDESNLHSVAMGLHFAAHYLDDGGEVVIFFNVKAPPLARKDLPETIKFRDMPPIKQMIAKLLKDGAKMVVCAMCADATGVKAEDLVPGIEMVKDRKQIFDHLHANTVVFTY